MSSMDGLMNELDSLKDRLRDAISDNDEEKQRYLEDRIDRIENESENLKYYNSL